MMGDYRMRSEGLRHDGIIERFFKRRLMSERRTNLGRAKE